MDLPLLTGAEIPHAPHIAVTATPWPGEMAVLSASEDTGYGAIGLVTKQAVTGQLTADLLRAEPARWSWQGISVLLDAGVLQSRSALDVLNGANIAAIGSAGNWEIVQFQLAELTGQNQYRLSGLLRGQAGTDGIMPDVWPVGSEFVLLDNAPVQLDLPGSQRDILRHYRVGPAGLVYDNNRYMHFTDSFAGVGERPYRVAHLRAEGSGDLAVSWIRRTRIGGDSWSGLEVPLAQESEVYSVKVLKSGVTLFETSVSAPIWTYTNAQQISYGAIAPFEIHVAQLSTSFGNGPFQRIEIND